MGMAACLREVRVYGLCLALAGICGPGTTRSEEPPNLDRAATIIVERTNVLRKQKQLAALTPAERLMATARDYAAVLARTDTLSHEVEGTHPDDRVKAHEYDFCMVAENIAYEFRSDGYATTELAEALVTGWKNSPGHLRNMVDPDLMEIGVGVVQSKESGKFYAVQVFGRPKSAEIAFQVVNEAGVAFSYHIGEEAYKLEPRYTRSHRICRAAEIRFDWSRDEGEPRTFRPVEGDQFVVTRHEGKLQAARQSAKETPADDDH